MSRDPLREQLDNASFAVRGGRRAKWVAEARAFAEPAWEAVERALAGESGDERREAHEFFASLPTVLPRLGLTAWIDAFTALGRRPRAESFPVLKALAQRLADEPDIAVALPLMLAGFTWQATSAGVTRRGMNWVTRQPWGSAAAVAVLLQGDGFDLHDGAFACLGWDHELPTAARGALWLKVWDEPERVGRAWRVLARLGEPAAIAAMLDEVTPLSHLTLSRPAITRALVRLIAGDDPWLGTWDPENSSGWWQKPEQIVAHAVELLPWAARACGDVDAARAVLASRWPALPGGAVAWALLGGIEAVPVLLEQLGEDDGPALALAALGPLAADAADAAQARLTGPLAALVEAALRPTPEALDRLVEGVDADLAALAVRHEQYMEGLITTDELCATLRRTSVAVQLWREHGLTWERQAAWTRAREALGAIGDFSEHRWLASLYD